MIKKSLLLMSVMTFFTIGASFAEESNLYTPQNSFVNVEYEQSNANLINYDKMNKKEKIEKASNKIEENSTAKLKLDTKEVIHQKALDYTTRQINSIPIL